MILVIAASAEDDLNEIGDYIARDNPRRAISFIEELLAAMDEIPLRPFSYPGREEWQGGLRSAPSNGYHIVFRVSGEIVEVIRVLHGARDIPNLF